MKAVLFDIYETLLTGSRLSDREPRLRQVLDDFGLSFPVDQSLSDRLDREIRLEHRRSPADHPEVDIREIWQRILPTLDDSDAFALAAEEAIHPVVAIPGAEQMVVDSHLKGLKLGIVSNAQAYTRVLLERHLGTAWNLFDPELLFFSYEHRISKPDAHLFRLAIDRLDSMGIAPHETLMIGDSTENDIEPAQALGLATQRVFL